MRTADVSSLFSRAEQAFAAGRLDAARGDLVALRRHAGDHPAVLHLLGLVERRRGDSAAARQAFERAVALAPHDAQLHNNFGNLLAQIGDVAAALRHYERAIAAAPGLHDARYNRALMLQKAGRLEEALAELDRVAAALPGEAKVQSARGGVLRSLGRLDDAAEAYDRALAADPQRVVALHGRARVAMERGEENASAHYRRALTVRPDDLELRLGFAEALEAEGAPGAAEALATVVAARPGWAEGQTALARIRWEAGEGRAFTRDLEAALAASPSDRALWHAYASALAAADLSAEAADAAARARATAGDDPALTMLEAVHASEAGQIERADRLFAEAPAGFPGRAILEARHRIRCADYGAAAALTDGARAEAPWDVGVWAMTALLWRLTGDARSDWLVGQDGLHGAVTVGLGPSDLERIGERLRSLHRTRAHPIGQSLRGGTQTRGRLFERKEPEIGTLREAIRSAVEQFWQRLPPHDPAHPLLRHRERSPRFDGSWSVRLTGGGFHVSHFHPNGILSSACYFVVPEARTPMEGWLEIGGAPGGLDVPIEPLARIEPTPGRLALFPSFLFHGTRPFAQGERLTVAFDVVAG